MPDLQDIQLAASRCLRPNQGASALGALLEARTSDKKGQSIPWDTIATKASTWLAEKRAAELASKENKDMDQILKDSSTLTEQQQVEIDMGEFEIVTEASCSCIDLELILLGRTIRVQLKLCSCRLQTDILLNTLLHNN